MATAGELLHSEQLWDRGFYHEVPRESSRASGGEKMVYPGAPYKLSASGWRLASQAPQVGEHNSQVYCDELGLSTEELQDLIAAGVV